MALAVTSGLSKKKTCEVSDPVTHYRIHTDQETFRRLWPTSGCNAMEEEDINAFANNVVLCYSYIIIT
jgi:hypothetical protein